MPLCLGLDTSNYTTSAALFDTDSGKIIQQKKLLTVKPGEKGLRQSDALFQHTKNIPDILNKLFSDVKCDISAVGVSEVPRDVTGSYMPCFLAGVSAASAITAANGLTLRRFSHQRGHIAAALYSANALKYLDNRFLAFHVSGGTTEMLSVTPDKELILKCEIIGGTADVNAGQIIDRAGVMMGLDFPCGKELELLAKNGTDTVAYPVSVTDGKCALSGIENYCRNLLKKGVSKPDIALFVFKTVAENILKMLDYATAKYGETEVVFSGGVMSNTIIKEIITSRYPNAVFALPEFSRDNAAGIAVLTAIKEGYVI